MRPAAPAAALTVALVVVALGAAALAGGCAAPSGGAAGDGPDVAAAADLGAPDLGAVDLGAADLPPPLCGNGLCEAGESGAVCPGDCCDAATPCNQTWHDDGAHYCRSMNGGPYAWTTAAATTALCSDPSQIGVTTYACGGEHGTCCSLPGGYVAGACM